MAVDGKTGYLTTPVLALNLCALSRETYDAFRRGANMTSICWSGQKKVSGFFYSRRPELPCVACVLFFPNDLSGHRFKHHFLSFLILDVV
jgi:hypothetical protein